MVIEKLETGKQYFLIHAYNNGFEKIEITDIHNSEAIFKANYVVIESRIGHEVGHHDSLNQIECERYIREIDENN